MTPVFEGGGRVAVSTTNATLITAGGGLLGFLPATSSSGTIALSDANGPIQAATPCVAGQFLPMPCSFQPPLAVTVTGTLTGTLYWVAA